MAVTQEKPLKMKGSDMTQGRTLAGVRVGVDLTATRRQAQVRDDIFYQARFLSFFILNFNMMMAIFSWFYFFQPKDSMLPLIS